MKINTQRFQQFSSLFISVSHRFTTTLITVGEACEGIVHIVEFRFTYSTLKDVKYLVILLVSRTSLAKFYVLFQHFLYYC